MRWEASADLRISDDPQHSPSPGSVESEIFKRRSRLRRAAGSSNQSEVEESWRILLILLVLLDLSEVEESWRILLFFQVLTDLSDATTLNIPPVD